MTPLRRLVPFAAVISLAICVCAFPLGDGVSGGAFENEQIPLQFLAKGIFFSHALYIRGCVPQK